MNQHVIERRATTLAEFRELMGRMISPEGVAGGLAFEPRPDDVIISPFAKCGTTWLQQLVHSLRTGGDLDFDDISRVVPWIETAGDLGLDLEAPQRGAFRAYKSHLPWDLIPKGGRYIVSLRDPRDAVVSMFRFMEGWFIEPGCVDLNDFARAEFMSRGEHRDYWHHLLSWWPRRRDEDVLVLAYEHMKADLTDTIRRVAAFLHVPLTERLLAVVAEQASLASMSAHRDKYDDRLMRELSERRCGLPPGSDSAKVRSGRVGDHARELSPQVQTELDAIWAETIEPATGLASYQALLAQLDDER